MSENSPKVDRRVRRSRRLIEQALFDLWQERGWDDISVMDIAERAGVNRSTFYAHYDDKYDLLGYSIRNRFSLYLQETVPTPDEFSIHDLHKLVMAMRGFAAQIHAGCHPVENQLDLIMQAQVQTVLQEFLLAWLQKSNIQTQRDTLALTLSWTVFGAGMRASVLGDAAEVSALVAEVVSIIKRMIPTEVVSAM